MPKNTWILFFTSCITYALDIVFYWVKGIVWFSSFFHFVSEKLFLMGCVSFSFICIDWFGKSLFEKMFRSNILVCVLFKNQYYCYFLFFLLYRWSITHITKSVLLWQDITPRSWQIKYWLKFMKLNLRNHNNMVVQISSEWWNNENENKKRTYWWCYGDFLFSISSWILNDKNVFTLSKDWPRMVPCFHKCTFKTLVAKTWSFNCSFK